MEEKTCSKCEIMQADLSQTSKNCHRLMRKLQEVHFDKDQLQANINEANRRQRDINVANETHFKSLLANLEELVRLDDTIKIGTADEIAGSRRNIGIEALELMASTLINVFKELKIQEFESKYETSLTCLIDALTLKLIGASSQQTTSVAVTTAAATTATTTSDINNNTNSNIVSSKLTLAITQDLNEFRLKTQICKEKLSQQKQMIQMLLSKIKSSGSGGASAHVLLINPHLRHCEDNSVSSTSETNTSTTSSCTTTSSSSAASFQHRYRNINLEMKQLSQQQQQQQMQLPPETFICPKCQIQVDSSKLTLKKLESHVRKCDPTKLACIFCLKLFEHAEQVHFESHVQKHLIKQSQYQSSPATTSSNMAVDMQQQQPQTEVLNQLPNNNKSI